MLSKKNKLTTVEIKNLFDKKGDNSFSLKTVRNNLFDVKTFSNVNSDNSGDKKFAVILSGKTFKKAVDRNKIKRRINSILEKKIEALNKENKQAFILIYPKKEIVNIQFQDLEKELYNVLNINF